MSGISIFCYRRITRQRHARNERIHSSTTSSQHTVQQSRVGKKSLRTILVSRHATCGAIFYPFITLIALSGVFLSYWSGHQLHQWGKPHHIFAPKLTSHRVTVTSPQTEINVDALIARLPAAGIIHDYHVQLPNNPCATIVVREIARPYHLTRNWAEVHPQTLAIVHTISYQHDYTLSAKIIETINRYHAGNLAGVINQIFLCILAGVILFLIFTGYRIWWLRRNHHYRHTPTLLHSKPFFHALLHPTSQNRQPLIRCVITLTIVVLLAVVFPMIAVTIIVCILAEITLWLSQKIRGHNLDKKASANT